jgi:hypothetical protein
MLGLNKLQFVVSLLTFVGIVVCAGEPTAAAVRIEGLSKGAAVRWQIRR